MRLVSRWIINCGFLVTSAQRVLVSDEVDGKHLLISCHNAGRWFAHLAQFSQLIRKRKVSDNMIATRSMTVLCFSFGQVQPG